MQGNSQYWSPENDHLRRVFPSKALHTFRQPIITNSSRWRLNQIACSWSFKGISPRRLMYSCTVLTLPMSPASKPLLSWKTNLLFRGESSSVSMSASPRVRFEVSYRDSMNASFVIVSGAAHLIWHSERVLDQRRFSNTGLKAVSKMACDEGAHDTFPITRIWNLGWLQRQHQEQDIKIIITYRGQIWKISSVVGVRSESDVSSVLEVPESSRIIKIPSRDMWYSV